MMTYAQMKRKADDVRSWSEEEREIIMGIAREKDAPAKKAKRRKKASPAEPVYPAPASPEPAKRSRKKKADDQPEMTQD